MINYKIILFVSLLLTAGMFVVITYIEVPAPQKTKTQLLDVNDYAVK